MLTIKPLGKAADALHYYSSKDNYYLKDKDSLQESSYWIGKGAGKLNLSGIVEQEQFLKLLNGELPNGEVLGIVKNGQREHRTGTDVTLSAPKSVSILALVGKDTRIIEAHKKAVAMTFARIEAMAAEARITFNKQTTFEKTNNLTGATFLHTSSRALDPDLHTHMVILNMTERFDKMWRALSSRSKNDIDNIHNGFTDILYQNQHYLGLVYMSTLAKEIKALGFDIRIKDIYGNFEIEGVSDEVITHLSKRRNEIMQDMKERGTNSAKAAEVSNKAKRQVKSDIDSNELFNKWLDDINELDIDLDKLIGNSLARCQKGEAGKTQPRDNFTISHTAIDALEDALTHLSEFNTQIKHSTLVRHTFVFSAGLISHEDIEKQIETKLNDKSLKGKSLEYYTTDEMLQKEKEFIKKLTANSVSSLKLKTQNSGLAATLLQKNNKVQIIDVNGMSNQKALIQDFIDIADSNDINAYVLHQSKSKSQLLSDEVSRKSTGLFSLLKNLFKDDIVHTVAGFKYQYGSDNKFKKKQNLVVVHDAQKLSLEDLSQLKEMVDSSRGRLILLNNTKSTHGFSPGSPIKTLKENGIEATTFIGARNSISVQLAIARQPINAVTESFLASALEKKEKPTLFAINNDQAKELTDNIRTLLKEEGMLSRQTKTLKVLSTKGLTDAEKKHTKFYNVGDRITFKAFTKEQKHYEVSEINKDGLVLTNQYGKQSQFKLENMSDFIVSRAKEIELSIGDEVVNDRAIFKYRNKFEKGTSFKVRSISQDGVVLESDKRAVLLDNEALANNYLSYNYCKKVHELTRDDKNILVAALPHQLNENLMGEITEFAKNVTLFTNNKTKAENFLNKEQLKWSAVDIAEKKPDLIYRDISNAQPAIEKDINKLINALELNKNLDKSEVASLAVSYAVAKCAEKQAAFKHSDLVTHALKYALGKADFEDIAPILKERMKEGELIHLGTYWTTKEAIELEENIIRSNFKEQGSVKPIESSANKLLSLPKHLTQGQKDAITLATTSSDRFVSVQGLAGVGKTTMMREVQSIANKNGLKVLGLAPTHQSKDELNDTGLESNTVESFLTHNSPIDDKTVLIVDESSMLDNQTYYSLQQIAIKAKAYVIFAGDITQLQSLASGIPHELTIKSGSQKTALMLEIIRQNPNPTLKKAAEFTSNRQIGKAFNELEKVNPEKYVERTNDTNTSANQSSFIEIKCNEKDGEKDLNPLYDAVAQDYLSRTKTCQKDTIVIVHAHKDRAVVDQKIRSGLQEQGQISTQEIPVQRLMPKPMDMVDTIDVSNLRAGDILRFGKTYHVGKRGEYFTIQSVDTEKNSVSCLTHDNLLINIKASTLYKGRVSAYTINEAHLAEGDKIRLKLTDENRGFVANKEYDVLSIKDGVAKLKNDKETTVLNLNEKSCQHWDYAYTNTAYSTQGATRKFIIALEILDRVLVTNHRSTEIDITRASHQGSVYTDDKAGLINRLEDPLRQLNIDKTSAVIQKQKYIDEKSLYKTITTNLSRSQSEKSNALPCDNPTVILSDKSPSFIEQKIDANEVLKSLNAQAEHLVKHLLGEPNQHLSKKNEYRYGTKGSFSVNLSNGLWHSFETGEGGNLFTLIQQENGFSSFKETLDYAVKFTRFTPDFIPVIRQPNPVKKEANDEGLRDIAIKLYNKSKPIKGSLVEKYLTVHRGVYKTNNADICYCPSVYSQLNGKHINTPALLAFTRNERGEINHIQVTKLDASTANKNKLFEYPKQTFGKINGHAVNLNHKGEGEITYLTEGVETGLSILESNPKARVLTVLGKENFAKVNVNQLTNEVVLCVDNDGKATFKYQNSGSNKILEAIEKLQENGIKINIILPKNKGEDLNDILIKSGKKALTDALNKPISPKEYKKLCDKQNDIKPKIKDISDDVKPNMSMQEEGLKSSIKQNELMKSSLIERLKTESMSHNIRITHLDIDAIKSQKPPSIPQKEIEKEL
tara:strand:+ start:26550 stop:32435 length:5886 start_codon:yes stop_codon:yes gene_type:complete